MKNKLSGFSLMEILVVLFIIAIVMAASAPMVNRKMLSTMAEKSPWVWTNTTGSIAYNLNGNDNQTTTIGAMALPSGSEKARLYISNNGTADGHVSGTNNSTQTPQIALGGAVNNETDPLFYIHKYGTSLAISSKKVYKPTSSSSNSGIPSAPSASASVEGAISIGNKAEVTANNSIAIGSNAFTQNKNAVAIGTNAKTKTDTVSGQGTAIGSDTIASGDGSAALGRYAKATADGAVAIGGWTKTTSNNTDSEVTAGAKASAEHSIAIGTGAETQQSISGGNNIAIGPSAKANHFGSIVIGADTADHDSNGGGKNAIAIGAGAKAIGDNATAIGAGAVADADNKIVIGTKDSIVYIPGQLRLRAGQWVYKVFPGNINTYSVVRATVAGTDTSSDRRLKNVGEVFTGGLEQIKKLEVFNYTFKKDTEKTPRVGVMAQDLQKIFPNAVFKGEDGFLRIRMEDMFYALVNAVKELDAKVQMIVDKNIAGLKKQIADLEEENRVITEKNVALEKQIVSLYEQNAKLEERMNVIEKQLANKKNK